MAKKRSQPTEKEAARAAASVPPPIGPLGDPLAALQAAQSLPAILAVVYGLPAAQRAQYHDAIAEARSRVLGAT